MISIVDVGTVFLVIGICFYVYSTVVANSPAVEGMRDGAITVSLLLFGVHHVFDGLVPIGILCILFGVVLIVKNVYYEK